MAAANRSKYVPQAGDRFYVACNRTTLFERLSEEYPTREAAQAELERIRPSVPHAYLAVSRDLTRPGLSLVQGGR